MTQGQINYYKTESNGQSEVATYSHWSPVKTIMCIPQINDKAELDKMVIMHISNVMWC